MLAKRPYRKISKKFVKIRNIRKKLALIKKSYQLPSNIDAIGNKQTKHKETKNHNNIIVMV